MAPPPLHQALLALLPPKLHAHCLPASFEKNETIFLAGARPQWMFYVHQGEASLERASRQGQRIVLQRARQGFVSEASLRAQAYHCDAIALAPTRATKIPVAELSAALETDNAFASRWITMLSAQTRLLRARCERLSLPTLRERIIHLIETEGTRGRFTATTGFKDLSSELGSTHEALYRALAAMAKSGAITREGNTIALP